MVLVFIFPVIFFVRWTFVASSSFTQYLKFLDNPINSPFERPQSGTVLVKA